MELLVFIGIIAIAALWAFSHKARARRTFRLSVGHYEDARHQAIMAGEDPSDVPTVEEFLAARGELHLLSEIGWKRPTRTDENLEHLTLGVQLSRTDNHNAYEFDDDGYDTFVAETWDIDGVSLEGIVLERITPSGPIPYDLYSLVTGANGSLYLNVYEDGEPKTYAADSRHEWHRNGDRIDNSAFIAVRNGVAPEIALRPDAYAVSFEQAASSAFDRIQTTDRKYIIRYRTTRGLSHRVVSKVVRYGEDRFSARCHFRWGERRTFLKANLLAVVDVQSGEEISTEAFLKKR